MLANNQHSHPELEGEYVAFVDSSRRYVAVSEGVCRLLGYSREQLLGKTIDDITPPELRDDVSSEFRQYVKQSGLNGEYILQSADGRRIPIRYESKVFEDGCMGARWHPLSHMETHLNTPPGMRPAV